MIESRREKADRVYISDARDKESALYTHLPPTNFLFFRYIQRRKHFHSDGRLVIFFALFSSLRGPRWGERRVSEWAGFVVKDGLGFPHYCCITYMRNRAGHVFFWCFFSVPFSRGDGRGGGGELFHWPLRYFCGGLNHHGIYLLCTWAHLHVTPRQNVKNKKKRRFTAYIRTAVCIGVKETLFWICYGGRNWRIQERNPPEGLTAARFSFLLFLFCFCSGSYSSPPPCFLSIY